MAYCYDYHIQSYTPLYLHLTSDCEVLTSNFARTISSLLLTSSELSFSTPTTNSGSVESAQTASACWVVGSLSSPAHGLLFWTACPAFSRWGKDDGVPSTCSTQTCQPPAAYRFVITSFLSDFQSGFFALSESLLLL